MMLLSNPITVKELRSRMRGLRAILPMMAYLIVLGVFVLMTFADYGARMQYQLLETSGRSLGFTLLLIQVLLVLILSPAYAASAITVEKERQTFGVMLTTLLTSWDIVAGKVFSGISYATLLVLSSLPLLSLSFWMGGFDFVHLLWGFLIIATCALVVTSLGILLSTVLKRSYLATGVTYGVVLAGVAFSYIFREVAGLWTHARGTAVANFSWDTIPFWLSYTLNPFFMLEAIDLGDVSNYSTGGGGFYNNPLIDSLHRELAALHVPYVAVHVVLSVLLATILLMLASHFLFAYSREGRT